MTPLEPTESAPSKSLDYCRESNTPLNASDARVELFIGTDKLITFHENMSETLATRQYTLTQAELLVVKKTAWTGNLGIRFEDWSTSETSLITYRKELIHRKVAYCHPIWSTVTSSASPIQNLIRSRSNQFKITSLVLLTADWSQMNYSTHLHDFDFANTNIPIAISLQ